MSTEREFDSPYYNFTRDIYTSLISKKRGGVINNKKILEIANKYVEDLGELRNTKYDIEYLPYEALYDLYVLTDDKNYLKMSYNKIDEEAEVLSKSSKPELKNEFLNRYFQKMIIDEYNKSIQMKKAGLYIHIPFCKVKCVYCDFYSITKKEDQIPLFTQCLLNEIDSYKHYARKWEFNTIFFGGELLPCYLLNI